MPEELTGYDFSGWATRFGVMCDDGRVIEPTAFAHQDGEKVPLMWRHKHDGMDNVLGHAYLSHRQQGVYAYGYFNDTASGQKAKRMVQHKDLDSLSIYANKLQERNLIVHDGQIRELSLALSGMNPAAKIDYVVIQHGDDFESTVLADEAVIYFSENVIEHENIGRKQQKKEDPMTDLTVADVVKTYNDEQKAALAVVLDTITTGETPESDGSSSGDGKSVADILNTMTEEQKKVFYFLVAEAADAADEVEHDFSSEDDYMAHNIFDDQNPNNDYEEVLSHDAMTQVLNEAVTKQFGSLRDAVLQHAGTNYGVNDITFLFPDGYTDPNGTPVFDKRDTGWVGKVMGSVHRSPFARIKTIVANITADEARAKGYVTGNEKKNEVFTLLKRTTTPTTIYKKQTFDRDDVVDLTDFDIIPWVKGEMRLMLNEEIARAILISDGRDIADPDKISEDRIRPIASDADLYTHKITFDVGTNILDVIDGITASLAFYKGSGSPALYCTTEFLNEMLLKRSTSDDRRIYKTVAELKAALRVSDIIEVPVMAGVSRVDGSDTYELLGVLVNLKDYTLGADKGGRTAFFEDFDIDFNQQKYLYETRLSGALTRPKAAIRFEMKAA